MLVHLDLSLMKNNYTFDSLRRVFKQKTEMYSTWQIGWLPVQGTWLGLVSQSVTWKKKKILPTYPIFFEPPVPYPDLFSYCWISISNKYVKEVVLIHHGWISPTLQNGWELEFCLFFKKQGRVHFSPEKGEVGKIVEEWRLLRENNLRLLANLCVYKSKKHYNPRYVYKSNKFCYIPKFLR